jgi:hypothetical protein
VKHPGRPDSEPPTPAGVDQSTALQIRLEFLLRPAFGLDMVGKGPAINRIKKEEVKELMESGLLPALEELKQAGEQMKENPGAMAMQRMVKAGTAYWTLPKQNLIMQLDDATKTVDVLVTGACLRSIDKGKKMVEEKKKEKEA